jgi:hypothetical protein
LSEPPAYQPNNAPVSKWLRPNSYLTIVSIYLFILAATGMWYLLFIATPTVLANYSLAGETVAVTIIMIIAPAIGGILLLREGWIRTGFYVSGTALIFWVLAMGYVVFTLSSLGFSMIVSSMSIVILMPLVFPFLSSLAMIVVLNLGWRKIKE